jgi:hypothetical protein
MNRWARLFKLLPIWFVWNRTAVNLRGREMVIIVAFVGVAVLFVALALTGAAFNLLGARDVSRYRQS